LARIYHHNADNATRVVPGKCGCQSGLDEEKAWKRQEIPAEHFIE
jgi:hypothetical protein